MLMQDPKEILSKKNQPMLNLGHLDHYTMIVQDALKVAEFHVHTLGFSFQYERLINTGTVPEGQYDMMNYVLGLPSNPEAVCVVTQGLNESTVFDKLLRLYGEGIHHVAYTVDDIHQALQTCLENRIELTSKEVITDPVRNLKQIFIARKHAGYFIELIERSAVTPSGEFTEKNMKDLAQSMQNYVSPARK